MSIQCKTHYSDWFLSRICINANAFISSAPFKCTGMKVLAQPSDILLPALVTYHIVYEIEDDFTELLLMDFMLVSSYQYLLNFWN